MTALKKLKQQIPLSRYEVAKIAHAESPQHYFKIGNELEDKLSEGSWGDKILDTISVRLQQKLSGIHGFTAWNLKNPRIF